MKKFKRRASGLAFKRGFTQTRGFTESRDLTQSRGLTESRGFTLLEVIVALAITGFILGSLFTLVAGSKQVTWRAEDSLLRATRIRAATNFALLQTELNEVEEILVNEDYRIQPLEIIEAPQRKTQPQIMALQNYQLVNDDREEQYSASRWIQLYVPE